MRAARAVVCALVLAGCAKKAEDQQPPPGPSAPAMPAEEVKRDGDACKAYVDRVCACAETVAAVKQQCQLAKALPEAIRLGLEIAANPDTKPEDAIGAQGSVRKAAKSCIEQTAKLPALGCP